MAETDQPHSKPGDPAPGVRSGTFLIETPDPAALFIPEEFDEEERMLASAAERFIQELVLPQAPAIEAQEGGVLPDLLGQAGELGLLGADVPEEFGGLALPKKASMLLSEQLGTGGSFGPAALVQTGIGGLPINYFGTPGQREKYLADIAAGKLLTAYALTETESGSDALAARTTARFDEAKGVYVLNGTKQFITNAGFAGLFIIFAKVSGDHFTCFLVEADSPGLSLGAEEHKMGLLGSSTRSVILEKVEVPQENVLGEVGQGHRIAFNVLNIGRLKLAPAVLGSAKVALAGGLRYALERHQFGQPLADFPLIKQKLAGAAMRIYCAESMCYRTAGALDDHIAATLAAAEGDTVCAPMGGTRTGTTSLGQTDIDPTSQAAPSSNGEQGSPLAAKATVAALKELSVECSLNKVFASEALDWVVDEMVQLHGGYGYIRDYPAEGHYRDSRINRIWEGTNEINRLLITGTLLKKALQGRLPLLPAIKQLTGHLMSFSPPPPTPEGPLGPEQAALASAKQMALFAAGTAVQKFADRLEAQQEVLAWIADMVMWIYAVESALLRTLKLEGPAPAAAAAAATPATAPAASAASAPATPAPAAAAAAEVSNDSPRPLPARPAQEMAARRALVRYAAETGLTLIEQRARAVLAASAQGDELRTLLAMLRRLARRQPWDLVSAGRTLADYLIEEEGYPFG